MGMFDYVRCEIPLPDGWEGELQSKDFDCTMTEIVIRANGRLEIERFEYEEVPLAERPYPDPDSPMRFAGSIRKVGRHWVDLNFHGDFGFGGLEDLKDDYWVPVERRTDGGFWQKRYRDHDYTARFSNGQLEWIRDDNAQGMALSENSRSEVEAEGRQSGPATQDAPPNSDPADNHSHRDNNASGKGIE